MCPTASWLPRVPDSPESYRINDAPDQVRHEQERLRMLSRVADGRNDRVGSIGQVYVKGGVVPPVEVAGQGVCGSAAAITEVDDVGPTIAARRRKVDQRDLQIALLHRGRLAAEIEMDGALIGREGSRVRQPGCLAIIVFERAGDIGNKGADGKPLSEGYRPGRKAARVGAAVQELLIDSLDHACIGFLAIDHGGGNTQA